MSHRTRYVLCTAHSRLPPLTGMVAAAHCPQTMLCNILHKPVVFGCMHPCWEATLSNRQHLHGQAYARICGLGTRAQFSTCAAIQPAIRNKSSLVHKLINPTLQLLVHCIRHFLQQATSTCQACAADVITHTMPSCLLVCFNKWATTGGPQAG